MVFFVPGEGDIPAFTVPEGELINYHNRTGHLVRVDNGVPSAVVNCMIYRALFLGYLASLID